MSARERFVACALAAIGTPYCTPPHEPRCLDCSGLVRRCYREATGQDMTGDSHAQYQLGQPVSAGTIQPGDLLFYDTGYSQRLGNRASHVGIYVGNNRMVNALNEDYGVVESSINSAYWTTRSLGARRVTLEGASRPSTPPGQPGVVAGPPSGEGGPNPPPSTEKTPKEERRQRQREREKRERDQQRRRRNRP